MVESCNREGSATLLMSTITQATKISRSFVNIIKSKEVTMPYCLITVITKGLFSYPKHHMYFLVASIADPIIVVNRTCD